MFYNEKIELLPVRNSQKETLWRIRKYLILDTNIPDTLSIYFLLLK